MAFGKRLAARAPLLAKVYALLLAQVLITAAVVFYLRLHPAVYKAAQRWLLLWFLLGLGIVIAIGAFPRMPPAAQLALMTAFSVVIGLTLLAASPQVPAGVIRGALAGVAIVFALMTVLGLGIAAAGVDLGFLYFTLLFALLALLAGMLLAGWLFPSQAAFRWMLVAGIVLFSILVAFDTNRMVMDSRAGVVESTLGLYLDIANLFQQMVGLGGSN